MNRIAEPFATEVQQSETDDAATYSPTIVDHMAEENRQTFNKSSTLRDLEDIGTESATIPYDDKILKMGKVMIPDIFAGLTTTQFKIATPKFEDNDKVTLFIPGFGVSVGQIELDQTLWSADPHTIVTHDAVNYKTNQQFMLWQYKRILRVLNPEEIRIVGISLGGSTAIQLLAHLQKKEPEIFEKITKVITLVSPVKGEDLTQKWQTVLNWCDKLAEDSNKGAEVSTLRRIALEAIYALGVKDSSLEAENPQETMHVFEYAAHTFNGTNKRELNQGMFGDLPITSFGLEKDGMAANTEAHKFSNNGKHIKVPGKHTPRFYAEQKELYDKLILEELRESTKAAPDFQSEQEAQYLV